MSVPGSSELDRYLQTLFPVALRHLKRLVEVNSFTYRPEGVAENGRLVAEMFIPLGFEPEVVPADDARFGPHLFLRRSPVNESAPARPFVLVTHLDTVFPPEEEVANNFGWRPEPAVGRIYGPGTVDIKGGTVMIWMVLQALADLCPQVLDAHEWLIAANSCEEALSADFGQKAIQRCPHGAAAVLVFESGAFEPPPVQRFTLVTGRKGKADFRVRAEGRGAHAGSYHNEGRNAIVALAAAVQKLASITDDSRSLTLNVGTIGGGTVTNRVPHEATAELELRTFDPTVFQEACDAVRAVAGPSESVPGATIAVEQTGHTDAWPETEATGKLLAAFEEAAAPALIRAEQRGGLSDANYLHVLGPTLDGLGPAGGYAHCSERSADGSKVPEFVSTDSFLPKAGLVIRTLVALAAGVTSDRSQGGP